MTASSSSAGPAQQGRPAAAAPTFTLLRDEPDLEADVAFGLAASGFTEDALAARLLGSWQAGESALRESPRLMELVG